MSAQQVYEAVYNGNINAVRKMVKANPSLEDVPHDGWTPLQGAAAYGHVEIVRYLVGEKGVDTDKGTGNRSTPLYFAAWGGRLGVVRYLAGEAGADKDKANVDGWTPLMTAAWNGHLYVVRCLLEEGADATLKNRYGITALDYAEHQKNSEIAYLLREYQPGGLMDQRRNAVINVVLEQDALGPDVARFCGEFVKRT